MPLAHAPGLRHPSPTADCSGAKMDGLRSHGVSTPRRFSPGVRNFRIGSCSIPGCRRGHRCLSWPIAPRQRHCGRAFQSAPAARHVAGAPPAAAVRRLSSDCLAAPPAEVLSSCACIPSSPRCWRVSGRLPARRSTEFCHARAGGPTLSGWRQPTSRSAAHRESRPRSFPPSKPAAALCWWGPVDQILVQRAEPWAYAC